MRRREFLSIVGAAAAWPLGARAQQPEAARIARLGFLRTSPAPEATMAALRRGLAEHGYVQGQRYVLFTSWGDGNIERLPQLTKELLANEVDIILSDGTETARYARAATDTTPIVLAGGLDPVKAGLASNLSHPDKNVTGFTTQVIDITGKVFELLTEISPGLKRIAVINPKGRGIAFRGTEGTAARSLGLELKYFDIDLPESGMVDHALDQAMAGKVQALVVRGSPFFSTPQRKVIVERVAAHRIPAIYETREFVELGGLISYGTNFSELFRLAAKYIVKILAGAKVRDLPIEQANTFELVVNAKAAKALGMVIPPTLIARADEVIE